MLREGGWSGVLVQPHAADSPQRRGCVRTKQPFLARADEAVLPGLLRVALARFCGLQHVVELHRCALGHIKVPLAAWHHAGRAEPASQRLQLGHAQPELSFQLAGPTHLLRLVESKHVHAGQLINGAVVVPVPARDVEEDLDSGLGQVNPGVHDKSLHLPVKGKKRGGGKHPWALKELQRDGLLQREGPIAAIHRGQTSGLVDKEGLSPGHQARIPHEVLVGLLQEERQVSVEQLVVDRQVRREGGVPLQALQDATVSH